MIQNLAQTLLFDITCEIEEALIKEDGKGRYIVNWRTLAISVPCRITNVTNASGGGDEYSGEAQSETKRLYCPTSFQGRNLVTLVRAANQCRIITLGRYFQIVGTPVDMGERGRMTRFDLIERDEGWVVRP